MPKAKKKTGRRADPAPAEDPADFVRDDNNTTEGPQTEEDEGNEEEEDEVQLQPQPPPIVGLSLIHI